jgi:translation initiation factor IF-3
LSRPFTPRSSGNSASYVRVNGKIRAREVRVIDAEGGQLGVMTLGDAITLGRNRGVDLVEIAPNANPPVCKLIDYGKYRYEQAKKEKEAKKHQHANKVKEIQLSANIDPHDFSVKLQHAINFLCEEMKVKVALRFRGREMAHQEFGFQQVNNFIKEITPWGHPDAPPKLIGKGLNVMLSPLPRNKRAKNPDANAVIEDDEDEQEEEAEAPAPKKKQVPTNAEQNPANGFSKSPFEKLESE